MSADASPDPMRPDRRRGKPRPAPADMPRWRLLVFCKVLPGRLTSLVLDALQDIQCLIGLIQQQHCVFQPHAGGDEVARALRATWQAEPAERRHRGEVGKR